ncbi:response regulator transcription factor [Bifidobacterium avesanii]|uniref:Response regulator n=1 Tax=Bifidobacterium avesanii TaxID=1798157 RepID=A0A7K3TK32_9BIFI|nr:response regulator transcription factor [Bifidobacterium avesanii]KAB8292024.1 DNA-binding response regulator [Bifidobacterium avesanii]NEG78613.1 response regulator [Bifidobacterium avesanii]
MSGVERANRDGQRFRIGVVDNDAMVLVALRAILRQRLEPFGITIAWAVRGGEEAVQRCVDVASRPDLVLVDMGMDDVDGATVCRRIRMLSDRIALLAMTSYSLNRYRDAAMRAGAQALLDKADTDMFVRRIVACAEGRPYAEDGFPTPAQAHRRLCAGHAAGRSSGHGGAGPGADEQSNALLRGLSDKEIEVMDYCIQGYTSREVAAKLGLTESTVKTHVRHAIAKLGVRNKLQAVQRWTALRAASGSGRAQ